MVKNKDSKEKTVVDSDISEVVEMGKAPVEEEVQETDLEAGTEEPAGTPLLTVVQEYYPDVTEADLSAKAVELISRLSSIQNTLGDVAEEYPEFGMMLNDVFKRMPPSEAIARNFGGDLVPPEDSPDYESYGKRVEEFNSMRSEKQAKIEQLEKNREISVENAQKFIQETGLEDEDAMKFLEWYDNLQTDMFDGLVSGEHLAALYKGYVHDSKIAEKDEEITELTKNNEVSSKNEAISKKNNAGDGTDGIPKLNSGGGKPPAPNDKPYGVKFFDNVL